MRFVTQLCHAFAIHFSLHARHTFRHLGESGVMVLESPAAFHQFTTQVSPRMGEQFGLTPNAMFDFLTTDDVRAACCTGAVGSALWFLICYAPSGAYNIAAQQSEEVLLLRYSHTCDRCSRK